MDKGVDSSPVGAVLSVAFQQSSALVLPIEDPASLEVVS